MPSASALQPYVLYKSPFGGHPILRRRPHHAYQATLDFLNACTDWDGAWSRPRLSLGPRDKYMPEGWDPEQLRPALEERFGEPMQGITFHSMDTGESATELEWPIPPEHLEWAIEFALSQPPAKRGWPNPVTFQAWASFNLRDPRTSQMLPIGNRRLSGRRFESDLVPSLSAGNTSAFFDLTFPFDSASEEFVDYVRAIRPFLPIRLAKGNFRLALPSKKRAQSAEHPEFTHRRIPSSLLASI